MASKTEFTLNYESVERIQKAIARCGETSEEVINDYLHNQAGELIAKRITEDFLPRSDRKKKTPHAKDSKWYVQTNRNLAVEVANSTKGKRGRSFYYLYFVSTGTGTSKKRGSNTFMEKGLENEQGNIVNNIIKNLLKNIEGELN